LIGTVAFSYVGLRSIRWKVHPSGQLCPVAVGPLVTVHRLLSNDEKWPLPRQSCQTIPSVVMWIPPDPYAEGFATAGGAS
jgi:hypothetical protein